MSADRLVGSEKSEEKNRRRNAEKKDAITYYMPSDGFPEVGAGTSGHGRWFHLCFASWTGTFHGGKFPCSRRREKKMKRR